LKKLFANNTSIFIQIADTYLHVVIESIGATRIFPELSVHFPYSRRLAPWCFDDENTLGTTYNKFFYGCGIQRTPLLDAPANASFYLHVQLDVDPYLSDFTNDEDTRFVIVRPHNVDAGIDWTGPSYGVSTQCAAIPETACIKGIPVDASLTTLYSFNCTEAFNGRPIAGKFSDLASGLWFEDWHQYGRESPPFRNLYSAPGNGLFDQADNATISNTTLENSNDLFRNPWHWIGQVAIMPTDDFNSEKSPAFRESTLVWTVGEHSLAFLMSFNTTGRFNTKRMKP
jgi:hypothetical protein